MREETVECGLEGRGIAMFLTASFPNFRRGLEREREKNKRNALPDQVQETTGDIPYLISTKTTKLKAQRTDSNQ